MSAVAGDLPQWNADHGFSLQDIEQQQNPFFAISCHEYGVNILEGFVIDYYSVAFREYRSGLGDSPVLQSLDNFRRYWDRLVAKTDDLADPSGRADR
ncbi:hypothetical protein D3C80_1805430 [compost metagenome]